MRTIQLIKDNAMLLIAGLAIVGFSSFKMINQNSFAGEKWFEYTNSTNDNDETNPANYQLTPSDGQNAPSCPTGDDETCAVHAQPQSGSPSLPNLSTVIERKMRAEQ